MKEFNTKIHFRLEQDEDGYPPVAVESLWARPASRHGRYVVGNIPFFVCDATIGDTVKAREVSGDLWYEKTVQRSGNSLIRVTFFDLGAFDAVCGQLESMGCGVEYLKPYNILAVDIPPVVTLATVQAYLSTQAAAGFIDYEEPILMQ